MRKAGVIERNLVMQIENAIFSQRKRALLSRWELDFFKSLMEIHQKSGIWTAKQRTLAMEILKNRGAIDSYYIY